MDGNTSPTYQCKVFPAGCIMYFDVAESGPDKSVFTCPCGKQTIEAEDVGTGA